MEKKDVLSYIQLYTGCNDHTLTRIKYLIDQLKVGKEEIIKYEQVLCARKKTGAMSGWAEEYMKQNKICLEDLMNKSRVKDVIKIRKDFCKEAYKEGYGASQIGRYLEKDHATIINIIKRNR